MGVGLAAAGAVGALPIRCAALAGAVVPAGLLLFLRPSWLVLGIPLLVPVTYVAPLLLAGFRMGLVELALLAGLAAWLARSAARRSLEVRPGLLGLLLLAWLWVSGLSLLGSTSLRAGLAEWMKWAGVFVVYLLAVSLLESRHFRSLVYSITGAAVACALLGLFQFWRGQGPAGFLLFGRFLRAYGTFGQPNPYAAHLGLSLPFAVGWALVANEESRLERLALLGAAALVGLGIIGSWSRGAWVATAAACVVMAALAAPRPALAGAILVLALSPLWFDGVASGALVQRMVGMGTQIETLNVAAVEPNDENWAVVERLAHWQAGWYMFASRPWLGVGLGQYEVVYPMYALPRWPEALGHAHNYYLNLLAETGMLGLGTFLVLGAAVAMKARCAWLRATGPQTRGVLVGVAGSLTYLAAHSMVDNLFVHGMQALFGLVLAAVTLAERGEAKDRCLEGV